MMNAFRSSTVCRMGRARRGGLAIATLALAVGAPVSAQAEARAEPAGSDPSTASEVRDVVLEHFQRSSAKMSALSEAMPEDLYEWAPGEGVMSVGRVYAHIARYNFMYLEENLGIPAPGDVNWESLESLTDKAAIREALSISIAHVRESASGMSERQLTEMTRLYGREVPGWEVLVQLVAHMNEHVGQAVAYARMNGIRPPWSS